MSMTASYYEINSNEDLIDKEWYKEHLSKETKKRLKEQAKCIHPRWIKKCSLCRGTLCSEHNDIETDIKNREITHLRSQIDFLITKYITNIILK